MPGIFFLCQVGSAPGAEGAPLAVALFQEGDWLGCRRECLRQLQRTPQAETVQLLGAAAALHRPPAPAAALATLARLSAGATDQEVRAMAAYELGRWRWAHQDPADAAGLLAQAFTLARDPQLFRRAGCSLQRLLAERPELAERLTPAVRDQLATSEALWDAALWAECAPSAPPSAGGLAARPVGWLVAFYRAQIRPAIGSRCSLTPSCSEYFLQAGRAHGWLAAPLIGDRLVREPSVVQAAEAPVQEGEQLHYTDPLSAHDSWLSGAGEKGK